MVDYALDFGNYEFVKYLMDNGHIWLVGGDEKSFFMDFNGGTNLRVLDSEKKIILCVLELGRE